MEEVDLSQANGRILGADLHSPIDYPRFDNSAMDGYAIRAADLAVGLPARLTVIEQLAAGSWPSRPVGVGDAIKIMTGAPIPSGADCVVPVEQTDGGFDVVQIRAAAEVGQHIRPLGEDIRAGEVALGSGASLHPTLLGYLASLGIARLSVRRAPRVGILATGDELAAPGETLSPGQIYSSNDVTLAGLARAAGADIRAVGPIPDRMEAVLAAVESLADWADVLLSSGGVSMGDFDLVRAALDKIGFREDFYRVQIKPGKPLVFGSLGSTLVFGLPGNPASAVVTFLEFVEPCLLALQGADRPGPPRLAVKASVPLVNKSGMRFYMRVALRQVGAEVHAEPLSRQGSGLLRTLAQGNALAILEPHMREVPAGADLQVRPLPFGPWSWMGTA